MNPLNPLAPAAQIAALPLTKYYGAWQFYAGSAVAATLLWWYITHKIQPMLLRRMIFALVPAILVVPMGHPKVDDILTPAWIAFVMESLLDGVAGMNRTGPLLLGSILIFEGLVFIFTAIQMLFARR
jgi:hypothetical protein